MRRFAVLCLLWSTGCSLDKSGTLPDDQTVGDSGQAADSGNDLDSSTLFDSDTPPDTSVADSGTDTAMPPPDTSMPPPDTTTCDTSACGTTTMKRVALVDPGTACPAGFTTTDLVEEKDGEACGCACGLTTPPTCPIDTVTTTYGMTSSCMNKGLDLKPAGADACTAFGFGGANIADYFGAKAKAATGGACGATPSTTKSAVSNAVRLCEPMSGTCVAPICGGSFTECIETGGSCPSEYPNARAVGTDVDVKCPACSCTINRDDCTGSVTFFSDDKCMNNPKTFDVNDTCQATPSGNRGVGSFKYKPNAPSATCDASFDSAAGTVSLTGKRTLCCR